MSSEQHEGDNQLLFCEMDELQANLEWKEVARWLKFEEVVENGGRWSKPHVASLQLHSLLELRNCLTDECIILDLPGNDLPTIIDSLLDYLINTSMVNVADIENIKTVLMSRHVHQHEKEFVKQIDNGEKKTLPIVKSIIDIAKRGSSAELGKSSSQNSQPLSGINVEPAVVRPSSTYNDLNKNSETKQKVNNSFMRKIPYGAEASNVLVGEVDFLDYQFSAFIRLAKSVVLSDFTEVPVPTRFLFIILGPKGNINKYHEIGRSISTLMSDEIFHEVAYKAKNTQELLNAFDLFLDQVTVLPPGEWDPNIRLEPPQKVPLKEERLERIARVHYENEVKNIEDDSSEHGNDPGLQFTGRCCGGLIDDIKRKIKWYKSDFTDGLNFQCLSSIMFMYFACLSPIITFGGLLGTATDQNMSAIESLVSGAICGILYSLFSGQPLAVLGSTGPVLIFEKILNSFSKQYGIDYMGFRALIGIWTAIFLLLIVVTDSSALVKYITRFTEETFAALIAFIFIKESIAKLFEINKSYSFSPNPSNYFFDRTERQCFYCVSVNSSADYSFVSNQSHCESLGNQYKFISKCPYVPDVFFFSIILYISTFSMAMGFRWLRSSRFFSSFVRTKISDFGVVITILINIFIDQMIKIDTPKLKVPLRFETTISNRGWFINPIERMGNKWWIVFLAIIPAMLATILIYMDQHITAVIINRKENKLLKSSGYHLDLLIVAITIIINSLIGIPWFVAATVLSINHVISLKKESETAVPGEKPRFLGVIEQRLTGTIVFIMIGSSVFLAKFLQKIPMPVLYGIFLYMGISSLSGIHFIQRLFLLLMPVKHQPDYPFLRFVQTIKVHSFTLIQLSCLGMLFFIKMNKTISIFFPLMVLTLVGVRKMMDYFYTQKELYYLDQVFQRNENKNTNESNKGKNECIPLMLNNQQELPQIVIVDTDEEKQEIKEQQ